MTTGISAPPAALMNRYAVNMPGKVEVIWQPLYHYQQYAAGGALTFTFFQNPIGQGGNTLSDTNMVSAGQIPKGQKFVITAIQVELYPVAADIYDATPDQDRFLRDYYNVMQSDANLQLLIGSKPYLQQAPLMKFPQAQRVNASTSIATGGATIEGMSFAQGGGQPFNIVPLTLTSNQNFSVTINFDAVVAISTAAKFGVTLQGFLFRNAQ